MKQLSLVLIFAFAVLMNSTAQGLGGALKNRLEKEKNKALEDLIGGKKPSVNVDVKGLPLPQEEQPNVQNDAPNNRPTQKTNSAGLTVSPKDIESSLNNALVSVQASNFRAAKMALRQAMESIDIQLGNKVLSILPKSVCGIDKSENSDQISGSGNALFGLSTSREYLKNEQWVKFSIINSQAVSMANSVAMGGMYGNTNSNTQQQKSISVKQNPAYITFDASTGYSISISLNQQVNALIEGVNIENENQMMKVAESFDLDAIKALFAQASVTDASDFESAINSAIKALNSERYDNSDTFIQQALGFINAQITSKIIALLPTEIGGYKSDNKNDNVSNSNAVSAIFIHRSWGDTTRVIEMDLISDSPIITSVNAIISMPFLGALGNSSQKVIKVDGQKALLLKQQSESDKFESYKIQIPLGNAMISISHNCALSESGMLNELSTIPVKKIFELAQ